MPIRRLLTALLLLALLCITGHARADNVRVGGLDAGKYAPTPDGMVARALDDILANKVDAALANIDRALSIRPDFKLAHLIKGDLLSSRVRPLTSFGGAAPDSARQSLSDLRDEARVRLLRYIDQPPADSLPKQILVLAPSQRYALLADAARARLYVFENIDGDPRLVADFYMTIGRNGVNKRKEGDKRTPVGVYTISPKLPKNSLSSFYGAGAYPLSYPNEWDLHRGNGGHGIWLHGVPPDTYSRPPKSSDGCVVVTNPDLAEIAKYVQGGNTPIVIAERTEWVDRDSWLEQRRALLDAIEAWKNDWQRLDADAYLAHYGRAFLADAGRSWVESKRRNIAEKSWIRVRLSDISVFLYPSNELAVISFTQAYDSDKHRDVSQKRLYLRRDDGAWRIALERAAPTAARVAKAD